MRLFRWVGWRRSLLLGILALAVGISAPRAVEAAGPWKAQLVDAATGQPLEGVVVLMYWITYTASWAGWAGGSFYDAEEVVTGRDGRFVIPARAVFTLFPWKKISREMVIFKPGYGIWSFRGAREWDALKPWESKARYEEAWNQFEGEGVAMELPPLKTFEERLRFFNDPYGHVPGLVPPERTKRLDEARDNEYRYLRPGMR